jgi:type II secretory pathway pseudopilin PulG
MFAAPRRLDDPRRGVTLVEMLVVVALVVLMMVILVQIFQAATGAMQASRTIQELDVTLRSIDSMIRADLSGVTAKMTPPNDPSKKSGYFEYMENAPADAQGEDSDDILAFTTKAPEGQVFTGRQWLSHLVPNGNGFSQVINQSIQPITITSEVAEVVYFLRNGNLYRRVFLVAPERASSLIIGPAGQQNGGGFQTSIFGGSLNVSWLGMNDLSARPGGFNAGGQAQMPILNDLGDLTNRENRRFSPRFINDFSGGANGPDGVPDDNNADGIPDYWPTLYFDGGTGGPNPTAAWAPCGGGSLVSTIAQQNSVYGVQELTPYGALSRVAQGAANGYDVYAFPFIYPGMYSVPDPNRVGTTLGWVHWLQPSQVSAGNATLNAPNHSPLLSGETPGLTPAGNQTWWGFPTWRETMAGLSSGGTGWTDPVIFVNATGSLTQALGLRPINPASPPTAAVYSTNLLPPVFIPGSSAPAPFSDGAGGSNFIASPTAPPVLWEDDLILSNVRSFDVKAYDPSAALYNANSNNSGATFSPGYYDLGYACYQYNANFPTVASPTTSGSSYVWGPNGSGYGTQNQQSVPWQLAGTAAFTSGSAEPVGFGHEGRIPPYPGDFRFHPRAGFNIGDPNPGVIRLTHTFDTWSTDYTNAPDNNILLGGYPFTALPIYPSFPPPYPSPLRGIQIQIRIADPRNERAKSITIRHDFTDKLN